MKNILVDALRQANSDDVDTDHALSDSGSFDASTDEFESTANDEAGGDALESLPDLELMETSAAIELPADPAEEPEEPGPDKQDEEPVDLTADGDSEPMADDFVIPHAADAETIEPGAEEELRQTMELVVREPEERHAVTIIGVLPRPVPPQNAPILARVAPLLCVAVAAAVAGGWLLYQKYGVARGAFGSSALITQTRAAHTPGIPETASVETANSRFPFLTIENDHDVERVVQ